MGAAKRGSNCWMHPMEMNTASVDAGKSGKAGRRLSAAAIRAIMHASNDGGRAQCFYCGMSFSMQYMSMCRVSFFRNEFVCAQCRKQHGVQRA
jgi:hypothetical protein